MSYVTDLDTPLLKLSPSVTFRLGDAYNGGVHVLGSPGSGKSSGTGETLAGAMLRAGMGGLVCVAKHEDVELWKRYAKKHGRERSVIIFDENRGCNFIALEMARQGKVGISNVVECLMRVLEAADNVTGAAGTSPDPFWPQATRQALNYSIPLIYAAYGNVTVSDVIDFVVTAASSAEKYNDPNFDTYAARTLRKVVSNPVIPLDEEDKRVILEHWFHVWPSTPSKTIGNITIALSVRLDRFKRGRLRTCFCSDNTDIVPEMTFVGAIIIMKMPVLTWNEDGIIGQQLFKFMWQRTVEMRASLEERYRSRGVFLWCDEAQFFCNLKDAEFLSTSRASRASVVFMTQTLPTYYSRLGRDKTDAADDLVGKFAAAQVFHRNACPRTNEFASKLIGRVLHRRKSESQSQGTNRSRGMNSGANAGQGDSFNYGSSHGAQGSFNYSSGSNNSSGNSWGSNVGQSDSENSSAGYSEAPDFEVEPRFFTGLRTGGPRNKNLVTAVWFTGGGNSQDGDSSNCLVTTFRQQS